MADKKLNISADLKFKTTDAEKTLKSLQKEGIKIQKIFKDLDVNTSTGKASFAKSLMVADKAMLKLRGTTQDTAKVMEHVYGKQLERQTKNLDNYTKKIDNLNSKFKSQQYNSSFQSAIGNNDQAQRLSSAAGRTADKILVAEAARQATQAAIKEMQGGSGRSIIPAVATGTMVTGAIAQAVGGIANFIQQGTVMEDENAVRSGAVKRSVLGSYMGGDFGLARVRRSKAGVNAFMAASDSTALRTAQTAGSVAQGAGSVANILSLGLLSKNSSSANGQSSSGNALIDAITAGGGIAQSEHNFLNRGGLEAQQAEYGMRSMAAQRDSAVSQRLLEQNLQGSAQMRLAASRRLGSRHQGIAAIGAGYGMDQGSALSAGMGIAEQFGGGFVTGGGFKAAAAATTKGFDIGQAGSIIGQLQQGGGKGSEEFSHIMAAGVKAGLEGVNIQFFEKMGQAIAHESVGRSGSTSGGNFADAMMFGINRHSSMADIQGHISGQAALNNVLTGGGNPFMTAVGYELSNKILGPNASGVKMAALNSAPLSALMGKNSEELDNLGVTKDQRKDLLHGKIEALARSYLGENSPEGKFLLEGAASAGGIEGFLHQNKHGREIMASVLKATNPGEFGDYKTARGAADFMGGIDSKEAKGFELGSQGDKTAFAQIQTQSKIMQQVWQEENKVRENMIKDIKSAVTDFATMFEAVGDGKDSINDARVQLDQLTKTLDLLAGAAGRANGKLGGSKPEGRVTATPQTGAHPWDRPNRGMP